MTNTTRDQKSEVLCVRAREKGFRVWRARFCVRAQERKETDDIKQLRANGVVKGCETAPRDWS